MMEFLKSIKTRWFILSIYVIFLLITVVIWLQTDFMARLSLLINLHRSDYCTDLSSSGKWLGCSFDFDDKSNAVHMDILSTDFPFQKITIDLPELINSQSTDNYYHTYSWSPAGDYLSVAYGLFEIDKVTYEFCVIQITNNGSYEVNCLPEELIYDLDAPTWSISGNSLFVGHYSENEGPVITVLSPKAEVLQRIDISSVTKIDVVDFEHAFIGYLGNESNMYFSININSEKNGEQLEETSRRTKIFRIPISKPSETTLLSEVPGAWEIVSIDPKVSQLLLRRNSSFFNQPNFDTYFDFQRMDIQSGQILDQIRIDALSQGSFYRDENYCSLNCSEMAFRSKSEWISGWNLQQKFTVSVWSWKTMSLSLCPNHDSIIGYLGSENGFIDTINYFEMKGPIKLSACQ